MMERIEALVFFGASGPVVKRVTWQGREYTLESTGRSWMAADGWHLLAMLPGQRVIELRFDPAELAWYMRPPASTV